MNEITGKTKLYAIVADPILQVKTPQNLNPLFDERGIDGRGAPPLPEWTSRRLPRLRSSLFAGGSLLRPRLRARMAGPVIPSFVRAGRCVARATAETPSYVFRRTHWTSTKVEYSG